VNRGKYKRKERVAVIEEIKDDGRNKMPLCIAVEKVKPVFDDNGKERKGRARVEVLLSKGRGKLSLRAEEVPHLIEMLQRIQESAAGAHQRCIDEQDAWERRNNPYTPKPVKDFSMGRGKTERKRKKKGAR
jgi:hypothetical protein